MARGQAARLLRGGMGRMIRGDHLDRAVRDPRKQGIAVSAAAQRRVHLEATVLLQILVAEQQVVRRRLATHAQALRPGAAHQFDALLRGHVADMVLGSRSFPPARCHARPAATRSRSRCPCVRARACTPRRGYSRPAAGRRPRSAPRPASPPVQRGASPLPSGRPTARRGHRPKPTTSGASAAKSTSSPHRADPS